MIIDTALKIPAPDLQALIQGRSMVILPKNFLDVGRIFALCPVDLPDYYLSVEQQYKSSFLNPAQIALNQLKSNQTDIIAWSKCELCQVYQDGDNLDQLASLTIWTQEALKAIISKRCYLFVAYLRVYLLSQPIPINVNPKGQFIALPKSLNCDLNKPVLNDQTFQKRCYQLQHFLPPLHPELEELQEIIAQYSLINSKAKLLDRNLQEFLGWSNNYDIISNNSELDWINNIGNTGNSSDGNEFEKLVRKSLRFLGFYNSNPKFLASLDPDKLGGAGGLDFYGEYPYPVVGECKATKTEKVPDGTVAQLIKLGYKHLQNNYDDCVKIIMAAGELTKDANVTAMNNQINVIRPETLQKLVEVKAKFPGSINLLELKYCLENTPFGEEADQKLNQYLEQIIEKIKIRSQIVEIIKQIDHQNSPSQGIDFNVIYGAYSYANQSNIFLDREQLHDILIELSSPLTGYLGIIEASKWESDRFYFLKDLSCNY